MKNNYRNYKVHYAAFTFDKSGEVVVKARTEAEAQKKAERELQNWDHIDIMGVGELHG